MEIQNVRAVRRRHKKRHFFLVSSLCVLIGISLFIVESLPQHHRSGFKTFTFFYLSIRSFLCSRSFFSSRVCIQQSSIRIQFTSFMVHIMFSSFYHTGLLWKTHRLFAFSCMPKFFSFVLHSTIYSLHARSSVSSMIDAWRSKQKRMKNLVKIPISQSIWRQNVRVALGCHV